MKCDNWIKEIRVLGAENENDYYKSRPHFCLFEFLFKAINGQRTTYTLLNSYILQGIILLT